MTRFLDGMFDRWKPSENATLGDNMRKMVLGTLGGRPRSRPFVTDKVGYVK
jgi:hypothetical protein